MSDKEFLKNSGKGAPRDRAGGADAPAPRQPLYMAPPCPVCGKAFSQEQLADPEFRQMALAGEVIHTECQEAEDPFCKPCRAGNHGHCQDPGDGWCECALSQHKAGPIVINSALIQRERILYGDGTARCIGTAGDMRETARLLGEAPS